MHSLVHQVLVPNNDMRTESAIDFYDLEGYDDAFLTEVTKVEAKHSPLKSPLFLSPQDSEQKPVQDVSQKCPTYYGGYDSVVPKKLDFTTTIDLGISFPSQELLQAHGQLCQEKALLILCHFPK